MKSLAQLMSVYYQCHTKSITKLTHYIGVPCIIFALQIVFSWVDMGSLCFAWLAAVMLLSYYFYLDQQLAIVSAVFLLPLTYFAEKIGQHHFNLYAFFVCFSAFFGGWALQFVGHIHEGKRPAFMENAFQVFVSPIFLVSELMFACGLRKELQNDMIDAANQP